MVVSYSRSANEEGNSGVKVVRHRLPFRQPELPDVESVVGRVDDVGVVELVNLTKHVDKLNAIGF